MRRPLTLASALLLITCTTSQFKANEGASDTSRSDDIVHLHRAYQTSESHVDRLLIASKLARNGDFTYWRFVRSEAEKVVRRDRASGWTWPGVHFGKRKPYDPTVSIASPPN